MVFLAIIDGKHFCGLCGSLLADGVKRCPVCMTDFEETLECVFCEQCSSITPLTVETCQICGAKRKQETARKPVSPADEPPPIPMPHHASETPVKDKEKPAPVETRADTLQHPPSGFSLGEKTPLIKISDEPSAIPPGNTKLQQIIGPISEKETDPAKLHAYIKELQEEISLLRMSIDDPEIAKKHVTPPQAPPQPAVNPQAIEKLVAMNKTLTALLEKMKKYETTTIFKVVSNIQKDVEEVLRLLKG